MCSVAELCSADVGGADILKAVNPVTTPQCHSNPNHCQFCGAWFKRKYEARRHVESVHYRIKPFKCDQCMRQFSRKSQMRDHILATHEKRESLPAISARLFSSRSIRPRGISRACTYA
eukprot:CAMPEP_0198725416 /NCGR_PEP_ID=MMETSP1475-20131203/2735_1 /TAXON_ID= ORGANISM="Unidentified sp., Strain CCMP1999" /NCGR_SAMPLE_ID=MMETSP1475 /ASSEMBLY_ACC=CAM_ASM_001111 /LENGTH=117 /DNA_ID=CAMNT_0044487193 /DNA_START=89 /DNA_END=443 /DNA_ORIENTATION=+